MKEYGNTNISYQLNPKKLADTFDIPLTKACQIVACFELGKRFYSKNTGNVKTIRTARQAFEYLSDMRSLQKEQLRGIYLNSRHRIVHDEVISIGSLTANIVHPREVFKPALEHSAVALILAHNHPSGSTKPTHADIETTKQLIEAGDVLGIKILDHIIITKNSFKSIPVDYSLS
jgi:DNA repair protein RadC